MLWAREDAPASLQPLTFGEKAARSFLASILAALEKAREATAAATGTALDARLSEANISSIAAK